MLWDNGKQHLNPISSSLKNIGQLLSCANSLKRNFKMCLMSCKAPSFELSEMGLGLGQKYSQKQAHLAKYILDNLVVPLWFLFSWVSHASTADSSAWEKNETTYKTDLYRHCHYNHLQKDSWDTGLDCGKQPFSCD